MFPSRTPRWAIQIVGRMKQIDQSTVNLEAASSKHF